MESPSITVFKYVHTKDPGAHYMQLLSVFELAENSPMYISLCLDDLQDRLNCTDTQLREYMGFMLGSQMRDGKSVLVGLYDNWSKKQSIDFLQEIKIIAAQYKVSVKVLEGEEVVNFAENVRGMFV